MTDEVKPTNEEEKAAPPTTEERLNILEMATKQLATDISGDIHTLAEQIGSMNRIISGVYSMAMAAQVLAEANTRYVAGYKAGEFEAEVNKALEEDNPEAIKLSSKIEGFDIDRYMALIKESAEAFIKIKEHEAKKRREEAKKQDSKIIQMPTPKIITP